MKRARAVATSRMVISAVLLAGCVGLPPPQAEAPAIYVLEARPAQTACAASARPWCWR